jgi:putative oxidoreductase
MKRILEPYSDFLYGVMRVILGFLFLCHGLQKLFGVFGGHRMPIHSLLGAAGIIEAIGGTLIALGLFTSFTAFICSGQMAFAYFLAHFPRGGLPVRNGGDIAVALCFGFLYIAARGGGGWSLDALLRGLSAEPGAEAPRARA